MMKCGIGIRGMILASLFFLVPSAAMAGDWIEYKTDKFGYKMLVPKGTKFKEKEWKGGWGGLYANYLGIELFGIAHLGKRHKPKAIEAFGVIVSRIPAKHWKLIDKGKKKAGWNWYRTYRATDGKRIVFAGLGTGPKGSYLLFLKTTVKDVKKNEAAYKRWYTSIKLF